MNELEQCYCDELVALRDQLADVNDSVDTILNRIYNNDAGFIRVAKRGERVTTVYQTLANVQRNMSMSIDAIVGKLQQLAESDG